MSHQNVSKDNGSNATKKSINGDLWEEHFFSSFNDMDQDLAKNIDTDGFCGGSTAITLIKKVNMLCPLRFLSFFFLLKYIYLRKKIIFIIILLGEILIINFCSQQNFRVTNW